MRKLGHPSAVMGLFALALEDELVLPEDHQVVLGVYQLL
jgi:hypothetical protein